MFLSSYPCCCGEIKNYDPERSTMVSEGDDGELTTSNLEILWFLGWNWSHRFFQCVYWVEIVFGIKFFYDCFWNLRILCNCFALYCIIYCARTDKTNMSKCHQVHLCIRIMVVFPQSNRSSVLASRFEPDETFHAPPQRIQIFFV